LVPSSSSLLLLSVDLGRDHFTKGTLDRGALGTALGSACGTAQIRKIWKKVSSEAPSCGALSLRSGDRPWRRELRGVAARAGGRSSHTDLVSRLLSSLLHPDNPLSSGRGTTPEGAEDGFPGPCRDRLFLPVPDRLWPHLELPVLGLVARGVRVLVELVARQVFGPGDYRGHVGCPGLEVHVGV
jgi:hypothetical protein